MSMKLGSALNLDALSPVEFQTRVWRRLSAARDPGYWANDDSLRYVRDLPTLGAWLEMHGLTCENHDPGDEDRSER